MKLIYSNDTKNGSTVYYAETKHTKGKKQYSIRVEVSMDDADIEGSFDFGNDEENALYLDRFKTGNDLVSVCIQVEVTQVINGHAYRGSDSLGGCHQKAGDIDDLIQTIEDHAMVDNAIKDLKDGFALDLKNHRKKVTEMTKDRKHI